MLLAVIFNTVMTFGISCTSALFLYLICDRALKPNYEGYVEHFANKKEEMQSRQ